MIWHMHDNEHNGELVLLKEMNNTTQYRFSKSSLSVQSNDTASSETDDENESSEDSMSESGSSSTNKQTGNGCSLFLNFSSDLTLQQPTKKKSKRQASYKVNGVNILNRKNLDSKTVIERIQRRRENHNHVERRRRDCINNTIMEISKVVPNACLPGQKLNKGNALKLALDHILYLQAENDAIKNQLQILDSRVPTTTSPTSTAAVENSLTSNFTFQSTTTTTTTIHSHDHHHHHHQQQPQQPQQQQQHYPEWTIYNSNNSPIIQPNPVTQTTFSTPHGNMSASAPYTKTLPFDSASAPMPQTNLRPLLPLTTPQPQQQPQKDIFISYYNRPQKNTCRYL